MSSLFLPDELVVFVGHSDDAQVEAGVVNELHSSFQRELRKHRQLVQDLPFTSVRIWEWNQDAEGQSGGQEKLIQPVVDTAHIAIFVFKERVGRITRAELERCRELREHQPVIYAVFPQSQPKNLNEQASARLWLELLEYKTDLISDWADSNSKALRPLKEYEDHNELKAILFEQFERDLPSILTRQNAEPTMEIEPESDPIDRDLPRDDFLARVETVCRLRVGTNATVTRLRSGRDQRDYLRVSEQHGAIWHLYPVSATLGEVTRDALDAHLEIHHNYQNSDSGLFSTLVYGGGPVSESLEREAAERRVRLRSFVEYQGLLDFRPYVDQQTQRLRDDPLYPPSLYVIQRLRFTEDQATQEAKALARIETWLSDPYGRFVLILGDFGTGKTFLLHELARRLGEDENALTPVLIEMRDLEKGRSLDELVAQHLAGARMQRFNLDAFRYMLAEGRIALLFDGFDELALRVSYDRATEHFGTLVEAASRKAKVVITSRTTHFESDLQAKTALGEKVELLPGRRVAHLLPFNEHQIRGYLLNRLGDEKAADARFEVIDQVKDLLGLSYNPRMLSFIADLDEKDLLAAKEREGDVTSAELYRLILERWLLFEYERRQPKGAVPELTVDERWEATTKLALRLWQSAERSLSVSEMSDELAAALTSLTEGLTYDLATHQVGSGTLLIRDAQGGFSFIHQSVMEWLVARRAAQELKNNGSSDLLEARQVSPLMVDFIIALASHDTTLEWAHSKISVMQSDASKKNALLMQGRLDSTPNEFAVLHPIGEVAHLAGQDLRGQDLSNRDLRAAAMSRADLTAARLIDANLQGAQLDDAGLRHADLSRAKLGEANLTGADLTGARLLGADLRGARLDQAKMRRVALVGASVGDISADLFGATPADPLRVTPSIGMSSPCHAVAWDPMGDLVATGHDDGSVRIWDTLAGKEIWRHLGHRLAVLSIAFSPDGKTLASGSNDKSVRLWNTQDGNSRKILQGHQASIRSIAISPDGRTLASGSSDKTIRLWNTQDGDSRKVLRGHQAGVRSVAFGPDGKTLASGSNDKSVRLWDTQDGSSRMVLVGHRGSVTSIAFSPDGKTLGSGSNDKSVRFWNTHDGNSQNVLRGHQAGVRSVAFSPHGKTLASGSSDRTVWLWNTENGNSRNVLRGHEAGVTNIAFSPDGETLASGSSDNITRLWDTQDGTNRHVLHGHQSFVTSTAFSPDGKTLASSSSDYIRLWDTQKGTSRSVLRGHQASVSSVAFSPDGRTLASGSADKTAWLWSTRDGKDQSILLKHQAGVSSVEFSPDGRTLASGSDDNTISLWNTQDGKNRIVLHGHQSAISNVAFSPDGRTIGSCSSDNTIRLWNTRSGINRNVLQGHHDLVRAIAFSSDGKTLASGSDDNTVILWNARDGKNRNVLQGHQSVVLSVAFSPDGKTLASVSDDKSVRLWNSQDGRSLKVLQGHQSAVWSVAFSPDGKTLASGSSDNTVRLWDVASGRCLVILGHLPEGWVAFTPEGRYKLGGEVAGGFWHSVNLCRFEPGELDPYLPEPLRMDDDEPFF